MQKGGWVETSMASRAATMDFTSDPLTPTGRGLLWKHIPFSCIMIWLYITYPYRYLGFPEKKKGLEFLISTKQETSASDMKP